MDGVVAARAVRDPGRAASEVGVQVRRVAQEGTMTRTRLVAALLVWVAGAASVAAAADVQININLGPPPPPIVVAAPPPLVVVPGVPVVQYAPSLQVDLFFHEHRWYYPHGGYWYVGPSYKGPWTPIPSVQLPAAIVAVPVRYYKIPPGHLKHLEKGGPPGHAKGKGKGKGKGGD